jgi:hypothetical protein
LKFSICCLFTCNLWLKSRCWHNRKWNSEIWKTYLSCVPLHIWIHWSLDFQVSKLAQNPETCSPQDAHPELITESFEALVARAQGPTISWMASYCQSNACWVWQSKFFMIYSHRLFMKHMATEKLRSSQLTINPGLDL